MVHEYIVVTLAAMLAGIGTGLVGLSAATAMVPLLIVLCPSFGGEHGHTWQRQLLLPATFSVQR